MKYIFKQIDNISGRNAETTIEFSTDTLPDVVEHFEMFIRGCGFLPSGTLDFIPDEEYYGDGHEGMGSTLDDYPELKEEHEWTQTLRDDSEWPFPLQKQPESIYDGDLNSPSAGAITQPWQGVAPSVAMQWTVDQLMKKPSENCSVCGISLETMKNQKCWDVKCPKGNDAY
jgi:hypothetical protein